jgi:tetratricopeptide (TPR) repeat protein
MKLKTLILLLLLTFKIYAQNSDNAARLESANANAKSNPDSALFIYKDIIKTESDTSVTYAKAFFNIAVIYKMKDNVDSVRIWYEKIMKSDFNPKQSSGDFFEPYTLYQHNAAMQLGVFLLKKKLYDEAYQNFEKALDKYPYDSPSGTSIGKRYNTIDIFKARCKIENGSVDEGLAILLSSTLRCYSPSEDKVNDIIKQILDDGYGHSQLKDKVNTGLKKIEFIKNEDNLIRGKTMLWTFPFGKAKATACYIGNDIKKEDVIIIIKNMDWYKGFK